jgi:hypothetical protein
MIDLSDAVVPNAVVLDRSTSDAPVSLEQAQLSSLSCVGCRFNDSLLLSEVKASGSLDLSDAETKIVEKEAFAPRRPHLPRWPIASRRAGKNWLDRQDYSPQSYEQRALASVLRQEGRPETAAWIEFCGKWQELKHVAISGSVDRAIFKDEPPVLTAIIYSFDAPIPLITLRKSDTDVDLSARGPRYYFHLHRALGWIFATFLVAGISG